MSPSLQNLLDDPASVPPLPQTYISINEAVEDPESSFEDIAHIVAEDEDLAPRILRLANSSFYDYPSRVSAIPEALNVIGLQQIASMTLAAKLPSICQPTQDSPLDVTEFWRHCIAVGLCSRIMALDLREANAERFFLAGLFHKTGRLVLLKRDSKLAADLLDRTQKENTHLSTLEREAFGLECGEVSAALLSHWQLPENLLDLVHYYAKPVLAKNAVRDVSLLHIADFITQSLAIGNAGERFVPEFSEAAWDYSGLKESRLYYVVEELRRQILDVSPVFLQAP